MSNEKISYLDIIYQMYKYVANAKHVLFMILQSKHFNIEEIEKFHNDYDLCYFHYASIYRQLDSICNGLELIMNKGGLSYAKGNEAKN